MIYNVIENIIFVRLLITNKLLFAEYIYTCLEYANVFIPRRFKQPEERKRTTERKFNNTKLCRRK